MEPAITSTIIKTVPTVVVKSFNNLSLNLFNKDIENILINKTDFEFIIDQKILLEDFPQIEVKPLALFLKSDEVELIVQQIYNPDFTHNSIKEIRDEFCLSFSRCFEVEISKCNSFASKLFDILNEGCKITLNKAISQGAISALDAKTQLRFSLIEDKIDIIDRNVNEILKISRSPKEETPSSEQLVTNYDDMIIQYLDKISSDFKQANLNNLYTELSFIEKPIKSIFPLTFKSINKENKPEEHEISEIVKNESKIIISGNSGFGKTTTLQWLAYFYADSFKDINDYVPIYVELNTYVEGEFLDYLILSANKKRLPREVFMALLQKGNAVFLLDGIDLISEKDGFYPYYKISNFVARFNFCKYIISSRPGFFDRLDKYDFKICEIEELTENKISSFIDKYVDDEKNANKIKNAIIKKENSSIFTNPLMLRIAIYVAFSRLERDEETILPSTRAELYGYFIENLFTHYREKRKALKSDKIQIENVAINLYFTLQSHNKVRCKWKNAVKLAEEKSKIPGFHNTLGIDVLDDLLNLGIIEKDGNYVKYGIHQSFQEYFAAIKLKELFENGEDISPAFVHPKWENTVIFASEMFENSDNFVKKIISVGEFELASKCSKNITKNLKIDYCNSLYEKRNSKYSLERVIAAKSLGKMYNSRYLKEFAKDEDLCVKRTVAEVLGDFKSDEAIEILNVLLENVDEYVTDAALLSLSNIGSKKAIESLFNAFKLENDEVIDTAIDVLSNIADKIDLDLIIEGLKDKNNDLRINCMYLLEYLDLTPEKEYGEIVTLLAGFLEDGNEDEDIREAACKVLIDIGNDKSLECVINLLINGNYEIREVILNSIYDEDDTIPSKLSPAIEPLIEQLRNETNCENRVNIIHILGLIGLDKVKKDFLSIIKRDCASVKKAVLGYLPFEQDENLDIIIDLLKEEDIELRIKAIKFLGEVKSKLAIDPLINLLDDNCPEIQENVILALGKINPEFIFEKSIQKMKDNNSLIKGAIINVAGKINDKKAANLLIELLKDEDPKVRLMAICYLEKMKLIELDDMLIECLTDENVLLRCNLVEILGARQSKIAIKSLIKLLEDKEDLVKIEAVEALKLNHAKEASNQLIMLLNTTDSELKRAVISALGDIGNENAGEIFLGMLSEADSNLKNQLVWSLGQMAYTKAFKPIILALEQDDSIYANSYFVLKKLNGIEHKNILEEYSQSDNLLIANLCFEMLNEVKKTEMMEKSIFENLTTI